MKGKAGLPVATAANDPESARPALPSDAPRFAGPGAVATSAPGNPETEGAGQAISGAAMDFRLPARRAIPRLALAILILLATVAYGAHALWIARIPLVEPGAVLAVAQMQPFEDQLDVRGIVSPVDTVFVDTADSGRVDEVFARDGSLVREGDPLLRLSNPQRQMDLLTRESELAQQISNLSIMEASFAENRSEQTRRLESRRLDLVQTRKANERLQALVQEGFYPKSALEDSADKFDSAVRALKNEESAQRSLVQTQVPALVEMRRAIQNVKNGVAVASRSVGALLIKAPRAGRLVGFDTQVGTALKQGDRVARIDDPSHYKVDAFVDEFYLSRIGVGTPAEIMVADHVIKTQVSQIFSQLKDGRFRISVELPPIASTPYNVGTAIDLKLRFGSTTNALVLPNGPWLAETGGAWAFVATKNHDVADKRTLRPGRRNLRQVEILEGLQPGEEVIVSSYQKFLNHPSLRLRD